VRRGARDEERFQSLPDARGHLARVRECLRKFTPWETRCNLPDDFDPDTDELPSLSFRGGDPDGEHEVEIRRFHALLHPECFERLLAALRLNAPDERLEVPQFQLRDIHSPDPPNGGHPPDAQLSEEDMQSLKEFIIQERERRRRFSPSWLRVVVDGAERARWPLEQSRRGQVEIAFGARLIEIYGGVDGGDMRLAASFLSYDEDDRLRPVVAALTLEGGQRLRLVVEPLRATDGEDDGAAVTVSYSETAPLRALRWRLRDLRKWFFDAARSPNWKPALAFMLLALSVAPLGYWLWIRRDAAGDNLASDSRPTPQISTTTKPTAAITPQPGSTASPTPRPSMPPPSSGAEVIAMDIRPRADEPLLRSDIAQAAGLLEAKKVYLEISGARREHVRQQLLTRLPADNKFSLTDDPGEAEVALKVTAEAARRDRIALTAHLADVNGKVIWPLTPDIIARKYEGPLEKVIATFSLELAADLRRLERQK
jgi:hypothetical protein